MADFEKELSNLLAQEEKERQLHPCCANCKHYYTEYGFDFCKCWEYPKENVNTDKCTKWR